MRSRKPTSEVQAAQAARASPHIRPLPRDQATSAPSGPLRRSTLASYALVVLVSAVCYVNSLEGAFVMDDTAAVVHNQDLRPSTPLLSLFENDYWGTPIDAEESHRSCARAAFGNARQGGPPARPRALPRRDVRALPPTGTARSRF